MDYLTFLQSKPNGLYRVETKYLCAGFVVKEYKVIACAPILRKRLEYFATIAKRISE
jgi:hypothetical protein